MVFDDFLIDSPGEYAENHDLGAALALYSYEADVVALLIAADDDYSLFPPCITCLVNREVIGIGDAGALCLHGLFIFFQRFKVDEPRGNQTENNQRQRHSRDAQRVVGELEVNPKHKQGDGENGADQKREDDRAADVHPAFSSAAGADKFRLSSSSEAEEVPLQWQQ